ncbi:MAG: CPBP family glutamic-type intramembrane protease [Elainellaceae cyanobacterium]
MTPRRLILGVLTVIVVIFSVAPALINSLGKPQITNRLQLYQTNLLLHASQIQAPDQAEEDFASIRNALLENNPVSTALEQYQSIRQATQQQLETTQAQIKELPTEAPPLPIDPSAPPSGASQALSGQLEQLKNQRNQQQALLNRLTVRIGLLQARQDNPDAALETWQTFVKQAASDGTQDSDPASDPQSLQKTASILVGMWSDPPRLLPDAEPVIQQNLDGWFRYVALTRLYTLQQRPDALEALQTKEQQTAQQAVIKLALVATAPAIGSLIGAGLLIFLIIQRVVQGKQALLAHSGDLTWDTPWNWEITWQVLIVGFFFLGQIVLPIFFGVLRSLIPAVLSAQGMTLNVSSGRVTAFSTLLIYIAIAAGSLLVLYLSIKPYFPLPADWFRFKVNGKWLAWGLGGYLVALPLVIGVSIINQQIWQGRGGNNPLLEIVLKEGDPLALAIFFFTAAIAAPVFEEILFRGFLLPSLTRYMPIGGAIALSSFLFASAHLSLSEILPLMVLGSVLGFVYVRSRNLLAPMLVHSLWNSATMIGLLILGGASG